MATRIGDAGNNNLVGTSGNDTILGLQGGDTVQGLGGSDLLVGGMGDDSIVYGSGTSDTGSNLIYGDEGADTITSAGNAGNNTILGGTGNPATDSRAGAGNGNDVFNASADIGNDLILGNFGDDAITVGGGRNTVFGGMGNDLITAGNGGDLLYGGEGSDTIQAGNGNNTIVGGTGNGATDSLDGADFITSGSGNDLILGNGGDDTVAAGDGSDTVLGGYGNDVILGQQGNDILLGNQGDDTLVGGMGDDTLVGGQGNDVLIGGEGNNLIIGGEGDDTAVYAGPRSAYTITQDSQGDFIIVGPTGTDTVSSTEHFRFSDGTVDAASLIQQSTGGGPTPTPAPQADRWINASGGDWNTATNWSQGLPTASTMAVIDIPGTYTVTIDDGEQAQSLSLNAGGATVSDGPGGTLTLSADLTIDAGSFVLGGGSLNVGNSLTVNAGAFTFQFGSLFFNTASGPSITTGSNGTFALAGSFGFSGTTVANGGTFAVEANGSLDAFTVANNGGTITIANNTTLTLDDGTDITGGSINIGQGSSLAGTATLDAAISNNGTIAAMGGTLNLAGGLTGSGVLEIGAGATLELGSGDSQPTVFTAGTGTLKLDAPANFSAAITGFTGSGDTIDLTNINPTGETASWVQGASGAGTLTLSHSGATDATLDLNGTYITADFALQSDDANGTDVVLIDRWIGGAGGNGNWNTAADWNRGVPTSTTPAVIDAGGTYTVTLDDAQSARSLTVDAAGATLLDAVGGALSLSGQLAIEAGTVNLAGGTLTAALVAVSAGALLEGAGTLGMPISNAGTIMALGGTLALTGALTGAGTLKIGDHATLELASGNSQAVTFATGSGTLMLDNPASFTSTIAGISGSGDVLDLHGFNVSGASGAMPTTATTGAGSYNSTTNITTLTVSDPSLGKSETFKLAGNYSTSSWTVTSDGHGGIDVVDPPAASGEGKPMSNEIFHFHSGSVQDVVSVLEAQRGQAALHEVAHDFSSLAAVIAATHPSANGLSTIVGLPNGNTITLAGLSEKQIKADAKQLGHLLFG